MPTPTEMTLLFPTSDEDIAFILSELAPRYAVFADLSRRVKSLAAAGFPSEALQADLRVLEADIRAVAAPFTAPAV